MNLVFWTESFYPAIGGTEISLYRQIKELAHNGNNIVVVSHDDNDFFYTDGSEVLQRLRIQDKSDALNIVKILKEVHHDERIDLLYIAGTFKKMTLDRLAALKELNGEINILLRVSTSGDIDMLSGNNPGFYLSRISGLICMNTDIEKEAKRCYKDCLTYLHYNGIPTAEFLRYDKFSKRGIYVFISRLSERKGVFVLLEAWKRYKKNGGKRGLLIYGPSVNAYDIDILGNKYFLDKHDITYRGAINNVWHYLNKARAIIIPSLKEGHPNIMLEAMACGVPIIGSDITGIREDILNSGAGILSKPGDADNLAGILLEMDKGAYDLSDMSRNGKRFIMANRTIAHSVRNLCDIILDIKRRSCNI